MENENINTGDNNGSNVSNSAPNSDTSVNGVGNETSFEAVKENNVVDANVNGNDNINKENINADMSNSIQEQETESSGKSSIANVFAKAVKQADEKEVNKEEESNQEGLDDGPHIHKVLIIEDNEVERTSLRAALETDSISVEAVENGFEAENLVRISMFDIAIVDYRLPDTDGLNLIKKLKISIPELMPLVVTAHSSVEIAVESLKMGAYDYMTKPLNIPNLIKTISTMIQDKETAISSRKKLVELQSKQGITYTASSGDEHVSIITTPNPDMLVSAETKISFGKKVKKFILAVKNFYWGS